MDSKCQGSLGFHNLRGEMRRMALHNFLLFYACSVAIFFKIIDSGHGLSLTLGFPINHGKPIEKIIGLLLKSYCL